MNLNIIFHIHLKIKSALNPDAEGKNGKKASKIEPGG